MKLRNSNKDKYRINDVLNLVKFVSYDGTWPNLCSGTLVISIDDVQFTFKKGALCSGGHVRFDENWSEDVGNGPWSISEWPNGIPNDSKLRNAITKLVNDNVQWGCCGGCV